MSVCSRGADKPLFEKPHFVAPHAVRRFRERVADIPAEEVIVAVQALLQEPGLPVDADLREGGLTLIYAGRHAGKPVYLPVVAGKGDWPCVPTVYGAESKLHGRLTRRGRAASAYWSAKEDEVLPLLRAAGFGIRACARILRRARKTVWEHDREPGRPRPGWPSADVQAAVAMRAAGRSCREIGVAVGRSEGGVATRLYRYRQAHPRDKRAVTTHPGPWKRADVDLGLAMKAEGRTDAEIGRAVGRSRAAVNERLRRARRKPAAKVGPWSQEELGLAHDLRVRGRTYAYVDRRLRRAPGATYRKLAAVRRARLADPRGKRFAALVGRVLKETRKEGIECIQLDNSD